MALFIFEPNLFMTNVENILARAANTCREHGTSLTEKRKKVLSGLLISEKALSAYELVDVCREQLDLTIPPMSVYRILDFLESENLVHKLQLTNKYVACSHISCDHDHEVPQFLICDECGSVKEIGVKKALIDSLAKDVKQAGFQLQSPQLELHCLCQDCAKQS